MFLRTLSGFLPFLFSLKVPGVQDSILSYAFSSACTRQPSAFVFGLSLNCSKRQRVSATKQIFGTNFPSKTKEKRIYSARNVYQTIRTPLLKALLQQAINSADYLVSQLDNASLRLLHAPVWPSSTLHNVRIAWTQRLISGGSILRVHRAYSHFPDVSCQASEGSQNMCTHAQVQTSL